MRRIHKGPEPTSLRQHRLSGGDYEGYKDKDKLREALLKEQGFLCCYCMQRISLRKMRVEHWLSQTDHPDRTVEYGNLLGVCTGGQNTLPVDQQHCDVPRKSTPLHVHPTQPPPTCEQLLRYLPNGEITSDVKEVEGDVKATLNLNAQHLVTARKRALDQFLSVLQGELKDGHWSPERLDPYAARWRHRDEDGKHPEYCRIVLYYLEKKLKKKA